MEKSLVIIFIGLLVFLAHAFVVLFKKTKVPDILYLIIIGLIIGPVLKLIKPEDFGKVGQIFSTIALVVILFEGGLELKFDLLKKTITGTMALAITTYIVTASIVFLFFFFVMQYDLMISLFVGSVLAGPAPAVVIPLARQLNLSEKTKTALTLEAGLGEAICILFSLAIFETIKLKDVQTGKAIGNIFASFLIALIIGSLGGYFWSLILVKIRQLRNAMFTTPSFVFIIYGFCEFLGFSGPIGVLAFGATLCNVKLIQIPLLSQKVKLLPIEHDESEKLFFSEIVFLLKTFFFVYLGLNIEFRDVHTILIASIVVLILLVTRLVSVKLAVSRKETSTWDSTVMSIIISRGLATAVLASLLKENNIPHGEAIQSVIYYTIVISVVATAILVFAVEKTKLKHLFQKFFKISEDKLNVISSDTNE